MLTQQLPKIVTENVPGPKAAQLLKRRQAIVPSGVGCVYPVVIEKAAGAMIQDPDGNIFLDWVGGVGVLNVGHAHPEVIQAVQEQATKFFHGMVNIVTHEGYLALAEKIAAIAPVKGEKKKTFFANSGAEAIENAVKIAKAATNRTNIIVFSGAFHGRTLLTMTMTSKKAYAKGMGPLANGVFRVEYPYYYRSPVAPEEALNYYLQKIEKVFEECAAAEEIAAVVLEPLQGEGGFIPAPFEYVKALRILCDEKGILLIADEVQTGFARTGKMFASNYWEELGFQPDILATAKSIAAGLPLSAVVARTEIMDAVSGGIIGGTYGGNALACAAGLKVLEIIEKEQLIEKSQQIGQKCMDAFLAWQKDYSVIGDVRGLGAMIGIEFVKDKETKAPYPEFVQRLVQVCVQKGLIIESAGIYGNVVRFLAPLVMTEEQLVFGLNALEQAIATVSQSMEKEGASLVQNV
jgi:4-aminobutyrate aminotransferase/(S)-3-amino-2-methylpropionate transaminase